MRKMTAKNFWYRYLRLVMNGADEALFENPCIAFTKKAKMGKYDKITDEEYDSLLQDQEQLSNIWQNAFQKTAGEILLSALSMTKISDHQLANIVEQLAICSTYSIYEEFWPKAKNIPGNQTGQEPASSPRNCPTAETDSEADPSDWSPHSIYDYLCQRIHGQEDAKKAASMIVYNHVEGRRSNTVFCGPSGCGKSEIWRHLSKDFPRLIRIVDASRLCADGWKGSIHLRDIFENISAEDLTQRGLIVVLDEADKICCERAIGSGGTDYNALVQNSLLKMMDGDLIEFGSEDSSKKAFQVDCSHVSVVLLGAFEHLLRDKSQRKGGIGFGADTHTTYSCADTDISYDDLIEAGMRREIAGRIQRIVSLRPLSVADYKTILMGPILDDLQSGGKYKIEIDSQSADLLAKQASNTGLGARWMRSQLMNAVDDLMFNDPLTDVYTVKVRE